MPHCGVTGSASRSVGPRSISRNGAPNCWVRAQSQQAHGRAHTHTHARTPTHTPGHPATAHTSTHTHIRAHPHNTYAHTLRNRTHIHIHTHTRTYLQQTAPCTTAVTLDSLGPGVEKGNCSTAPGENKLYKGELCDVRCKAGWTPRGGTSARFSCSNTLQWAGATMRCDPPGAYMQTSRRKHITSFVSSPFAPPLFLSLPLSPTLPFSLS